MLIRLARGIAVLALAAAAATAQAATELEARSYILNAFISGVAETTLSPEVALAPQLRKRLALPEKASRKLIYEKLFSLTADRTLTIRKATAAEAAKTGFRGAGKPVFVLQGGSVPLLIPYDLEKNQIPFVGEP